MDPARADKPPTPYVYAIGTADHRHIKIGYSTNMSGRFGSLQTDCPLKVSILWTREGDQELEGALHEHFADYRSRGEWFEFPAGQDAVELISQAAEEIAPHIAANGDGEPYSEPYSDDVFIDEAPEDIAATLRIPIGSPVLRQQRVIYEDGEPVEVAMSWIREGRVTGCAVKVLPDGSVQAREPSERDEVRDRLMTTDNPFLAGGRPYRSCIGPVLPARIRRMMS